MCPSATEMQASECTFTLEATQPASWDGKCPAASHCAPPGTDGSWSLVSGQRAVSAQAAAVL